MEKCGSETPHNIKKRKSKYILPAENTFNKSEGITASDTFHAGSGITVSSHLTQIEYNAKEKIVYTDLASASRETRCPGRKRTT